MLAVIDDPVAIIESRLSEECASVFARVPEGRVVSDVHVSISRDLLERAGCHDESEMVLVTKRAMAMVLAATRASCERRDAVTVTILPPINRVVVEVSWASAETDDTLRVSTRPGWS